MSKLVPGLNDLKTLHPGVAAEADGWDPATMHPGTHKKMSWKCKEGHTWNAQLRHRTSAAKSGCPYCANQKILIGFNDLKTKFPALAKEADGWDPSTVITGTRKKMPWKCKKGHTWETTASSRISQGRGCPYCANQKVWTGFNDLKTKFPEIAKEADGWDPSTVLAGSNKRMSWKCNEKHTWNISIDSRTSTKQTGCPYCSNKKLWVGFNDLKTKFPEVAKEADGWDPSTVIAGSNKSMPWKCNKGHKWNTRISKRTCIDNTNCPECAEYGFNPAKPSWFYLMHRRGEQQLGITNDLPRRISTHARSGWIEIESTGPHSGKKVLETEKKFKKWLMENIGLVPDKQENWYTSNLEVFSLAELKKKSGIDTSIF